MIYLVECHFNTFFYRIISTAGQEEYARLRTLQYPGTDLFILAFAIDRRVSFENVEHVWYPEILEYIRNIDSAKV